jgi:hypothetical protein
MPNPSPSAAAAAAGLMQGKMTPAFSLGKQNNFLYAFFGAVCHVCRVGKIYIACYHDNLATA